MHLFNYHIYLERREHLWLAFYLKFWSKVSLEFCSFIHTLATLILIAFYCSLYIYSYIHITCQPVKCFDQERQSKYSTSCCPVYGILFVWSALSKCWKQWVPVPDCWYWTTIFTKEQWRTKMAFYVLLVGIFLAESNTYYFLFTFIQTIKLKTEEIVILVNKKSLHLSFVR